MESQEFIVLYTHQKTKKSKVWQDGTLRISPVGSKAILYDDKGQCLESLFLKCLEVKPGDGLESDRYLITVEEVKVAASSALKQETFPETPASSSRIFASFGRSLGCQPAGLKRKFTGFQGPRQVPQKVTIRESGESTTSPEPRRPSPASLLPLQSTSTLFATAGSRDTSTLPTYPEGTVAYKNPERISVPFFSAISNPSLKMSPEVLSGDSDFLPPVSAVSKHSSGSGVTQNIRSKAQIVALLKSKSTGTSKELRSGIPECFPQMCPQGSLKIPAEPICPGEQGEQAEAKSADNSHFQRQPGSGVGASSRWAVYLPSDSSPVHPSTGSGVVSKSRPQAWEDNNIDFNLEDVFEGKRTQLFETHTEEGRKCNEDMPVGEMQEVQQEISSFCEANNLPVACSNEQSSDLLSEPDIHANTRAPASQNDQMCIKESGLTYDAQGPDPCEIPEREHQQPVSHPPEAAPLQTESSLGFNRSISDDVSNVFSKGQTDHEDQESLPEAGDSGTQPLMEVTFDLNAFETSDTEEESQGSSKISQDSEGEVGATLAHSGSAGVPRGEDRICKEVGSGCWPLLTSSGDKPMEPLLSQFCDNIYVGFDTGLWKARKSSKETEEEDEPISCLDASLEWLEDAHAENHQETLNKSVAKDTVHDDFTLLPDTPKCLNTNVPMPHFLNTATNQTPENSLFSEQAQPQASVLRKEVGKNEQILPWAYSHDNGLQLLSASHCPVLGQSDMPASSSLFYPLEKRHPVSESTEALSPESEHRGRIRSLSHDYREEETTGEKQYPSSPRKSSELSGLKDSISLLKSLSEHTTALEGLEILKKKNTAFQQQKIIQTYKPASDPECENSMLVSARRPPTTLPPQAIPECQLTQDSQRFPNKENFPKGSTTFQIEDTFQVVAKSDPYSFENDLTKGSSYLVNKNLPSSGRPQLPPVTWPPVEGSRAPCSRVMTSDRQVASAAPMLSLCQEPSPFPFSFRPEHQYKPPSSQESRGATPVDASHLHSVSSQSKWLKYQNTALSNLAAPGRPGGQGSPGSQAGERPCEPGHRWSGAADSNCPGPGPLQIITDMLWHQQQDYSGPGLVSRRKELCPDLQPALKMEGFQDTTRQSTRYKDGRAGGVQEVNGSELCFPSGQKINSAYLPQRQIHIPAVFQSPAHYKQVFTSCLIEHLNILLFGLAQRLHKALSKVDLSFYTSAKEETPRQGDAFVPSCHHQQPAKLVAVRKEGPNQGRLFYTCDGPKADRCKFFKWLEEVTPGPSLQGQGPPSRVFSDIKNIGLYLRSQKIPLYEECQLSVRKGFDFQRKQYGKLKKFATVNPDFYSEPKSRLYLKLSRKESSSAYSKNDLWVVSKTLDFELDTFIACSAFFGPSSANEVEILPLRGYYPSNWPPNSVVHALLVCNASTELTTLKNIQDHFNPATLPIIQHLLTMTSTSVVSTQRANKRRFIPPAASKINTRCELLGLGPTLQLAREFIQRYKLNEDQATALVQMAHMMASHTSTAGAQEEPAPPLPVTIIHGVFGAGKSYLLAVVILFFVQLFEKSETPTAGDARPWKLLISSSTNVAVDRVLLGLLSLGFEKFVRVGSIRKIARPVLPYSLHAGSENENEQLKELNALMKEDLTPMERVYVRKSIEQHKLGTNRKLLKQVRVVGVTCAACPFPCLNELKFPVVLLDECSQITEPAALLPIARFECEKLILVGDPKQLPPTIQGSDAAHQNGLEQTLFDRLCLMGHKPVLLRTQYRCHPTISAIANDLFYEGSLRDGIEEADRGPLLEWLPTLCFYNVKGLEQVERDNSFHNVAEAAFTLKLIQSLLASGIVSSGIGVITLYKSQMYKLCHLLAAVGSEQPPVRAVQVSTVDAFQGAEKEVIILSCVRTQQVGFIDSEKRMNVALTRGRRHLLIVGHLACLRKNRLWARVIQHCEGRKDGLQLASQCELQLDRLLQAYSENQAEEKQRKKRDKES
ncbi:protein ZGRF1 [Erinaceus europaeus]|uniref:Protein ZGRF1 n=1 Tax=Erinaceus europaeus TaxID=9365 RepID=A0ABM3X077_ERIEU|nr:protein ZGRF1 [Erinaceus europaeus]